MTVFSLIYIRGIVASFMKYVLKFSLLLRTFIEVLLKFQALNSKLMLKKLCGYNI